MRKDKEMHISVYVYVCGGRGEWEKGRELEQSENKSRKIGWNLVSIHNACH